MATESWRTRQGDGGMRPSTFRSNWSSGRQVIAFLTFSNMAAVHHLEFLKFLNLVMRLPLSSKFVATYQISSKSDRAFGLQTPITAKCSMRGC